MSAIKSIYIPHVELFYTAEYIADVLDRSGIAKVSKIAFEHLNNFKRAWVDIKYWHDTEAAFNLINRLRDPSREARLVHADEYWWSMQINKYPHKTDTALAKNHIIVFQEVSYSFADNDVETYDDTCDCLIDIMDYDDIDQDTIDFDTYCREIDEARECWL